MDRRSLLRSVPAVGIGGALAGCLRMLQEDDNVCTPGYRRIDDRLSPIPILDYIEYLSLNVSPPTVTPPDEFTVELTNEAKTRIPTLGPNRYMIQRLSSDGNWINTLGVPTDYEWDDDTVHLEPGDEFTWKIEPKRGGFPAAFERCTSYTPATYRFVYWGLSRTDTGLAIAAPFEILED